MPRHLPAFLVTTWLLAMLPGAGQAVMIRQVLAGGLRTARGSIAGNAAGLLLGSMAAAAGRRSCWRVPGRTPPYGSWAASCWWRSGCGP
ncbi:hypothetical protein [Streptomyces gibsoniae]|uniref:Uncharacterized protein n=1 Tax=Streptomyces gibsoniae TaxID=3075529 RepID=A0ABU2U6L7_9ACTN|nr:hypothetical protein [Streptomyces sp. DSM 41699]MDT0468875.1 hypothetical protein [Streptomyces sp. DSM 41699]